MNRRDFMVAASGVAGAGAAAAGVTPVAGQEDDPGDNESETDTGTEDATDNETADGGGDGSGNETDGNGGGGGGGGTTETVEVGDNYFEPASLTIEPGTTVEWVWVGEAQHNVEPEDIPDEAEWEGHPDLQTEGEYSHTFETEGTYDYICRPHVGQGMRGEIVVDPDASAGPVEVDIHDVGVPIQKHFVGIATFLAIFVSLVFTFYLLKYGESPHSSSPGRK